VDGRSVLSQEGDRKREPPKAKRSHPSTRVKIDERRRPKEEGRPLGTSSKNARDWRARGQHLVQLEGFTSIAPVGGKHTAKKTEETSMPSRGGQKKNEKAKVEKYQKSQGGQNGAYREGRPSGNARKQGGLLLGGAGGR